MEKYEVKIKDNGTEYWKQDGKMHRVDGPAYKRGNIKVWFKHGELHREDGPAIESPLIGTGTGKFIWYIDGKRHREDGPAYINKFDNIRKWYRKDKLHRDDGPAIIDRSEGPHNEVRKWYRNGKLHRDNGPAIEYSDVFKPGEYYLFGEKVGYFEFIEFQQKFDQELPLDPFGDDSYIKTKNMNVYLNKNIEVGKSKFGVLDHGTTSNISMSGVPTFYANNFFSRSDSDSMFSANIDLDDGTIGFTPKDQLDGKEVQIDGKKYELKLKE